MPSLYGDDRWISGHVLSRDPRIWYVDQDENIRLQRVEPSSGPSVILTAVVVASNISEAITALGTLAGVTCPLKIVVVCSDPEAYSELAWLPHNYQHIMPQCCLFKPNKPLDICDSMTAGFQKVKTTHFCVLGAHSMVHTLAFDCIGAELGRHDYDILTVKKLKMNEAGWVHYDTPALKPIWRTNYVLYTGGFRGDFPSVEAAEAHMLTKATADLSQGQLDALLFYVKD